MRSMGIGEWSQQGHVHSNWSSLIGLVGHHGISLWLHLRALAIRRKYYKFHYDAEISHQALLIGIFETTAPQSAFMGSKFGFPYQQKDPR